MTYNRHFKTCGAASTCHVCVRDFPQKSSKPFVRGHEDMRSHALVGLVFLTASLNFRRRKYLCTCQIIVKKRVWNGTPYSILWITDSRDRARDLSIPRSLSVVNVVTGRRKHHSSMAPNTSPPQAGTKYQEGYSNHTFFCISMKIRIRQRSEG